MLTYLRTFLLQKESQFKQSNQTNIGLKFLYLSLMFGCTWTYMIEIFVYPDTRILIDLWQIQEKITRVEVTWVKIETGHPIKWDSKGWEETCPVWWTTKAGGSFSNLSLCYALKTFGDEVELRGMLGGVRGRLAGRQQVLLWRRGEAIIIIMLMIGLVWKRRSSGWWGRSTFDKESGEKQGRLAGQWGKAGLVTLSSPTPSCVQAFSFHNFPPSHHFPSSPNDILPREPTISGLLRWENHQPSSLHYTVISHYHIIQSLYN